MSPEEVDKKRREEAARTEAETWELTSQSNSEQLLRSFMTTYPYSKHRGEAARTAQRGCGSRTALFWVFAAAASLIVVAVPARHRAMVQADADRHGGHRPGRW